MLYLFYGSDFEKVREKSADFLTRKPTGSVFRFNAENFNRPQFEELVNTQGLFEDKYTVVLDRVFENAEAKDFILRATKDLKESPHLVILLEAKIDKATLAKLEKSAEKIQEFVSRTKLSANKSEEFNIFSLTNALEKKDKKQLWILYQGARLRRAPEEIHGVLWWKVKTMILSGRTGKFGPAELKEIATRLVSIYHDAHRGLFEFDLALEKFILEL